MFFDYNESILKEEKISWAKIGYNSTSYMYIPWIFSKISGFDRGFVEIFNSLMNMNLAKRASKSYSSRFYKSNELT